MKVIALLALAGLLHLTPFKESVYVGSTPVESTVRKFFGISLTDSIDFMRWKLRLQDETYIMNVEYGLCKNGTPGFSNGKQIELSGKLRKDGFYYYLDNQQKTLSIQAINSNLLQLLDENKKMLIGSKGLRIKELGVMKLFFPDALLYKGRRLRFPRRVLPRQNPV